MYQIFNYRCPFNYIGSKSKLLTQILPIINTYDFDILIDLFAGGFSVGVNSNCNNVIYNDINNDMVKLIRYIYTTDINELIETIYNKIYEYNLSVHNREAYYKLRYDFNNTKDTILFLLLIYYGFNHQIRYNKKGEFNTPFGYNRSKFTRSSEIKLISFAEKLKQKNITFMNKDFINFPFSNYINSNTLFFCDPPYLITVGSYNDGNRGVSIWNEEKEIKLLQFLDDLNKNNIYFVLTNIIVSGNLYNYILIDWMKKYKYIYLDSDYSHSNYHKEKKEQQEVMITNLDIGEIYNDKNNRN